MCSSTRLTQCDGARGAFELGNDVRVGRIGRSVNEAVCQEGVWEGAENFMRHRAVRAFARTFLWRSFACASSPAVPGP